MVFKKFISVVIYLAVGICFLLKKWQVAIDLGSSSCRVLAVMWFWAHLSGLGKK